MPGTARCQAAAVKHSMPLSSKHSPAEKTDMHETNQFSVPSAVWDLTTSQALC